MRMLNKPRRGIIHLPCGAENKKGRIKMLENRVIEKLVEFGGNHWTKVASKSKKAIDRVYFGAKALGLTSESELIPWEETEWSGVNLNPEKLPKGLSYCFEAGKHWIDCNTGEIHTTCTKFGVEIVLSARLEYLLKKAEIEAVEQETEDFNWELDACTSDDMFEEDFEEEVQAEEETQETQEVVSLPNDLNEQQHKNLLQICKNYSFLLQKAVGFTKLELY